MKLNQQAQQPKTAAPMPTAIQGFLSARQGHALLALAAMALAAAGAMARPPAQFPQSNPAGGVLARTIAEAWSFSAQMNSTGATAQVTTLANAALEVRNAAGATVFVGEFSGELPRSAVGSEWALYDDE